MGRTKTRADDLGSVTHFLEFVHNGVDTAGANKEDAIRQAADDFLREPFAREQFRG